MRTPPTSCPGGAISAPRSLPPGGPLSASTSSTSFRACTRCPSTTPSRAPRRARTSTGRSPTCTAASSSGRATEGRSTGRRRSSSTDRRGCAGSRTVSGSRRTAYWSNQQTARMMWYHDHAVGITRLNAYAGLAAELPFLIDVDELRMFGSGGAVLPDQIPGIPSSSRTRASRTSPGRVGTRWGISSTRRSYGPPEEQPDRTRLPMPAVSCVPEFFADTPVINGMAYPQLTLAGRRPPLPAPERHPVARAGTSSSTRRSGPNKGDADTSAVRDPTSSRSAPRAASCRAGGRPVGQSVRSRRVPPGDTSAYGLVLAGAERADVLIDFSDCAGQSFILYNDAQSPFPDGERGGLLQRAARRPTEAVVRAPAR